MKINHDRIKRLLDADKVVVVDGEKLIGYSRDLADVAKGKNPEDIMLAKVRRNKVILETLIDYHVRESIKELVLMKSGVISDTEKP